MKNPSPTNWEDTGPIPEVKHIPKPDYPRRTGVAATGTAILIFVALFCIFQYWLLTSTLEAYHMGDDKLPLGAFLTSLGCFILAAGLTLIGEIALMKQQDFIRRNETRHGPTPETSVNSPGYTGATPPSRNIQSSSEEAGGGDAG